MISQLILQMVCISFAEISIVVTHLGGTIRRGGFYPLYPAVTSTVGFFSNNKVLPNL